MVRYANGAKLAQIEDLTGIKKGAFHALLHKAKARGYELGGPVKDEHVQDAPRSGRPKVIDDNVAQTIEAVVTKDKESRMYSSYEIADIVARCLFKR